MKSAVAEYMGLLDRFLNGSLSTEEFQMVYLKKFKNERRIFGGDVFEVLQELFGDIDAFSDDPELLLGNPDFYIDASGLQKKVRQAANKLAKLNS